MTFAQTNAAELNKSESQPSRSAQEKPRFERLMPLLIFVLCACYLLLFRHYSSLEPDEGIVLEGAERILRGQLPYRDFFSFYTPGSFYLVAACFRVFGDSFVVARTSLALTSAACSVITYLLARRVCSRAIAAFVAILATVAGTAYRFLVLHNWYSTLLCCLAAYSVVKLIESHRWRWAFASGSFVSLTFLFEQSKGAGLLLGLAIGFLILRLRQQMPHLRTASLVSGVLGFLWPLLLTTTYFSRNGGLDSMLASWFWPLQHYAQANRVPYGFQSWSDHSRDIIFHTGPAWIRAVKILAVSPGFVVPVLPLIAIGLLLYWSAMSNRRQLPAAYSYYVLLCSAMFGLLISVVIVRADIVHFMYLAPLWYVLLAWILDRHELRSRLLDAIRPYLLMFVAAAFGLMAIAVLVTAVGASGWIETRRGWITTGGQDTVIEYVQAHTSAGATILVHPYLPLYYYLTATQSPSRYDYVQPGLTTPEQFQEVLDSLQSQRIEPALFEPGFTEKIAHSWPATPLAAIAHDPVADYIARHYRLCAVLNSAANWQFEYMVRREATCR